MPCFGVQCVIVVFPDHTHYFQANMSPLIHAVQIYHNLPLSCTGVQEKNSVINMIVSSLILETLLLLTHCMMMLYEFANKYI